MLIAEKMGVEPSDVFDDWVERVDTARYAQEALMYRGFGGRPCTINGVKVEVKVKGDYYWLIINNKKIRAWHKNFKERYGLYCLAWEMAKSFALTWRSVRG